MPPPPNITSSTAPPTFSTSFWNQFSESFQNPYLMGLTPKLLIPPQMEALNLDVLKEINLTPRKAMIWTDIDETNQKLDENVQIMRNMTMEYSQDLLDTPLPSAIHLDTEQLVGDMKTWLGTQKIDRSRFSALIMNRMSLHYILNDPEPWDGDRSGKCIYVRMYNWLNLSEEVKNHIMTAWNVPCLSTLSEIRKTPPHLKRLSEDHGIGNGLEQYRNQEANLTPEPDQNSEEPQHKRWKGSDFETGPMELYPEDLAEKPSPSKTEVPYPLTMKQLQEATLDGTGPLGGLKHVFRHCWAQIRPKRAPKKPMTIRKVNEILGAPIDETTNLDTEQLVADIQNWLKTQKMTQKTFAEHILNRNETSCLRKPIPWKQLKRGREIYKKMHNWLKLSEEQKREIMDFVMKSKAGRSTHPSPSKIKPESVETPRKKMKI